MRSGVLLPMHRKLASVNAGDAALIGTLISEQAFMRRLARALMGSDSAADDLVQDTATAALGSGSARNAAATREGLRAWLTTTMRRRAIGTWRAEARRRGREERAARPMDVPSEETAIDRRLDAEGLLARALATLPAEQRRVVALRYGDDLTPSAIAQRLGLPLATVKTQLRRALVSLRGNMDKRHNGLRNVWVAALTPSGQATTLAGPLLFKAAGAALVLAGAAAGWRFTQSTEGEGLGKVAQAPAASTESQEESALTATEVEATLIAAMEDVKPMVWGLHPGTSGAVLNVEFQTADDFPPRGTVRFISDGAPTERIVELRGHPSSGTFAIDVPSTEDLLIEVRFDGFTEERFSVRASVASGWRAAQLPLTLTADSETLTLVPVGGELVEGRRYFAGLEPIEYSKPRLYMPLRGAPLEGGKLRVGRLPAGDYRAWLSTYTGDATNTLEYRWVADEIITVGPSVDPEVPLQMQKGGTLKLNVIGRDGQSIAGALTIVTKTGRRVRAGSQRGGRFISDGEFPAGGPFQVTPRHVPPGAVRLLVTSDGHAPASKIAFVESGQISDVSFELTPLPPEQLATPSKAELVWPEEIAADPNQRVAAWSKVDGVDTAVLQVSLEGVGETPPAGLITFSSSEVPDQRVLELRGHRTSSSFALRIKSDAPLQIHVDADGYESRAVRLRAPARDKWGAIDLGLRPTKSSGELSLRPRGAALDEGQKLHLTLSSNEEDAPALRMPMRRVVCEGGSVDFGRLPAGRWKAHLTTATGWSGTEIWEGSLDVLVRPGEAHEYEIELERYGAARRRPVGS